MKKYKFEFTTKSLSGGNNDFDPIDMGNSDKDCKDCYDIVTDFRLLKEARFNCSITSIGSTQATGEGRWSTYLEEVKKMGYTLNIKGVYFIEGDLCKFHVIMETDMQDEALLYAKQVVGSCVYRDEVYSTYCDEIGLQIVGWKEKPPKLKPKCEHETVTNVTFLEVAGKLVEVVKCSACGVSLQQPVASRD